MWLYIKNWVWHTLLWCFPVLLHTLAKLSLALTSAECCDDGVQNLGYWSSYHLDIILLNLYTICTCITEGTCVTHILGHGKNHVNVWCIKNCTNLSNVLLLCLVQFLMHQTLNAWPAKLGIILEDNVFQKISCRLIILYILNFQKIQMFLDIDNCLFATFCRSIPMFIQKIQTRHKEACNQKYE